MNNYNYKHNRTSIRLQNWDYGWNGAYFITICTKNRIHHFGEVVDGRMQLSPMGAIADVLWHEIKNHAKNVKLGQFVVMPNHIHGILILDKPNVPTHPTHPNVGARHALPLRLDGLDGLERLVYPISKYHEYDWASRQIDPILHFLHDFLFHATIHLQWPPLAIIASSHQQPPQNDGFDFWYRWL